jgi:hypothetical protein
MVHTLIPESTSLSTAREYRVRGGKIEARGLDGGSEPGADWSEVSPELLRSHVLANTAVARWLERNLGWRHLLRACVGLEPNSMDRESDHQAHACH